MPTSAPPSSESTTRAETSIVKEIMAIQQQLGGSQVSQILGDVRLPGRTDSPLSDDAMQTTFCDAIAQLQEQETATSATTQELMAFSRQLQTRHRELSMAYRKFAEDLQKREQKARPLRSARRIAEPMPGSLDGRR
ncbi:MAG: hypothetical protein ACR2NP_21935 [Pirellulaceae bacterium]